ncbi:MAG: LacI family transcriptional regulator [Spirochaetales bacterium]|nr:LacI family transcriptional regulator [Spirochaetales bacterium]MCF7939241.1 LacI family transcriptional regulator [Spirochaetales bacterium]
MGIKEIAELAGVSKTTVSLALNGHKGVSSKTRTRITRIAKDMNYQLPANKSSQRSYHGVIVFTKLRKHGLILTEDQNSFILHYIDGINHAVKNYGYTFEISTQNVNSMESMESFASGINMKQPKGVIVLGTELDSADVLALDGLEVPYVIIDTYFGQLSANFVNMANVAAVHNIIEHFSITGHTDISMITCTKKTGNVNLREQGFRLGMEYFQLPLSDRSFIPVSPGFDGAYLDMLKFLDGNKQLPEALFCFNDVVAFGVIKALKEHNITVPDDISIIGFDDMPMSSMMEPHLTSFRVPNEQIGSIAARSIIEQIQYKEAYSPRGTLVSGNLIVRDSVKT